MPTYKLTYFDLKGLGESIRMILSYMGEEFEDHRIAIQDWPATKNTIKFGKVPVLDVDGKRMYQAQAILRFLAKKAKLAGDNDLEAYEIDSIVGTVTDFISAYAPIWGITDPKEKEEFIAKLKKESIPYYMKEYNEIAGKNNGYLANGKLSWADLFFHGFIETFEGLTNTEVVNQYPNLKQGRDKVHSTPGIKEWIDKRPQTTY
uniref:glutathione transferase n=3 Tax=Lygus hesperus TaxID=30085 RepID=A0A146M6R5_LYGHE